jgi:2-oxoglutarate dehydrogenase E1 component
MISRDGFMSEDSVYSLTFGSNAGYLAELYQLFREDPSLVAPEWAEFFRKADTAGFSSNGGAQSNGSNGSHSVNGHAAHAAARSAAAEEKDQVLTARHSEHPSASSAAIADRVINSFRRWGHLAADLSPIRAGGMAPQVVDDLEVSTYTAGRAAQELNLQGVVFAGRSVGSVPQLVELLKQIYCGTIGYEYEHIVSAKEREWLRARIESRSETGGTYPAEERKRIAQMLIRTGLLESELHRKYVGSKWFSVDGNDSLIPALQVLLDRCLESGVREAVFGMAHRGRINFLVNTLGMPLERLFAEFEDRSIATAVGAGDVKYHLGWTSEYANDGRSIKLELLPNPSHLEFVNPVVEGVVRAKQDSLYQRDRRSVLPVVMHGDAAFAGQGTVFECLNYAALEGYSTGGTFHIVINNQIGFTTTPDEGRSTRYCTDLAKGLDIPVFHVNAEDPEAACWIAELALEYRNAFGKDVMIDLIGHRKYGHNEGDDPSFTQPLTYQEIKSKKQIWQQYTDKLVAEGVVDQGYVQQEVDDFKRRFAEAQERVCSAVSGDACALHGRVRSAAVATAVSKDRLVGVARELLAFPEGFVPHPKLLKIIQKRVETVEAGQDIEWGVAEALAYGTLVEDGIPIRLSGQDCRRGTFSHRHLVLDDYEKAQCWSPLGELARRKNNGGRFEVYNSSLSESAVVGFEFGYAASEQRGLTLWEAQFGDFSNGAQCIIDQFISSSEAKWGQLSGVTLLLPHGFEGQGPEHSSARLERYLQLCAEGNMSVCYPTNAAQYFHLVRRQGLCEPKRPLIVMTPKSLLRLPVATTSIEQLCAGSFQPVLVDAGGKKDARTVVIMSGKVYYDVAAAIKEKGLEDQVKVARIEELYPFPEAEMAGLLKSSGISRVVWVQEEPVNQGAWGYMAPKLRALSGKEPVYVGRPEAGQTATGSAKRHAQEQKAIIADLLQIIVS